MTVLVLQKGRDVLSEPKTTLGHWLRTIRLDKKITQAEAARLAGMKDQSEWGKWERGESKQMPPDTLKRVAQGLDTSAEAMALANSGIWPGDKATLADILAAHYVNPQTQTALPDDPVALADAIGALTKRLVALTGATEPRRELPESTSEPG